MPHTASFNKLWNSTKKQYLNQKVPKQYQAKYGKKYDKKEVKSVAYAIAKVKGIKIDK